MGDVLAFDLELIAQAIQRVGRRARLGEVHEDFAQDVYVQFLTHPAIARNFRGISAPSTYVYRVVWNFFLNWKARRSGRWRPSATARRLGPIAVQLEKIIKTRGLPVSVAVDRVVQLGFAERHDAERLATEISGFRRLRPSRQWRATETQVDANPETLILREQAVQITTWLQRTMGKLSAQDRYLLSAYLSRHTSIAVAATDLGLSRRHAYSRLETLLRHLRQSAATSGVDCACISKVLEHHLIPNLPVIARNLRRKGQRSLPLSTDPPMQRAAPDAAG